MIKAACMDVIVPDGFNKPFLSNVCQYSLMADLRKDLKNVGQNIKAKAQTAKDHVEGKPSSDTLNRAKIKARDAARDLKRDL
jgi:hypothetical protein